MLYALLDNKKVEPTPKKEAMCPLCEKKVISKCGDIKVWHWAHSKGKNCDKWYEPETYWHRNWKLTFGKENCEIKIEKDGSWHVADVYTKESLVIELQNSPIQKNVILERELFYGDKMIWLINGIDFKENFHIKDIDNEEQWWGLKHNNCNQNEGIKIFNWEYSRRSWEYSQRHVFIDFHDGSLFWVLSGMGSKFGKGRFVSKQKFVSKYGGDYKLHLNLFRNYSIKLKRKKLRLKGVEGKNIHFITAIIYKGRQKMLEIYFENQVDIYEIKKFQEVSINGFLNYEDENKNLQLLNSKLI